MSTLTQQYTDTLLIETCCVCHINFGMPEALVTQRQGDHYNFYCPLGHSQHYTGLSTEEKLRRQLKSAEAQLVSTRDQLTVTERQRRAQKGIATKLRKKIAAGVCPVCNAPFHDVGFHMTTNHPDFTLEDEL